MRILRKQLTLAILGMLRILRNPRRVRILRILRIPKILLILRTQRVEDAEYLEYAELVRKWLLVAPGGKKPASQPAAIHPGGSQPASSHPSLLPLHSIGLEGHPSYLFHSAVSALRSQLALIAKFKIFTKLSVQQIISNKSVKAVYSNILLFAGLSLCSMDFQVSSSFSGDWIGKSSRFHCNDYYEYDN